MKKCKSCYLRDSKPCYECSACARGDDHYKYYPTTHTNADRMEPQSRTEEGSMMEKCSTCMHCYPSVECVNCGTGFRNYLPYTPPTNADYIRRMSDEELAEYIFDLSNGSEYCYRHCAYQDDCATKELDYDTCIKGVIDWLKQPAKRNSMRLIDEKALIEEAKTGGWGIDLKELRMILKYVPAIDAVPVVRCKECEDYNTTGCSKGFGWCESMDRGVSDDFYCANGAKMESEVEEG